MQYPYSSTHANREFHTTCKWHHKYPNGPSQENKFPTSVVHRQPDIEGWSPSSTVNKGQTVYISCHLVISLFSFLSLLTTPFNAYFFTHNRSMHIILREYFIKVSCFLSYQGKFIMQNYESTVMKSGKKIFYFIEQY